MPAAPWRRRPSAMLLVLALFAAIVPALALVHNADALTAPSVRAVAGVARSEDTSSLQSVMPASWSVGDTLMLDIAYGGAETDTLTSNPTAAGWTKRATVGSTWGRLWRFTKTAVAGQRAPLVSFSGHDAVVITITPFKDVGAVGNSGTASDGGTPDSTPIATPNLTVADTSTLVVGYHARAAQPPSPTVTPAPGYVERAENIDGTRYGTSSTLEMATRSPLAAGTYGGDPFTPSVAVRDTLIVTELRAVPSVAPSPRGMPGVAKSENTSSLQSVMPPTWQAGDLLMLDIAYGGTGTDTLTSALTGWTPAPSSPATASYGKLWRFTKTATSDEIAPLVSFSNSNAVVITITPFKDVGAVGNGGAFTDSTQNTTPATTPNITVGDSSTLVVGYSARAATSPNPTVSPGSNYTEQGETPDGSVGTAVTLEMATSTPASGGTYGGGAFTPSLMARDALLVTELRPTLSGMTSSATTTTTLAQPNVSDKLIPKNGAWWGDYVSSNPADVGSREALAGRTFDVVHFFEDFDNAFPTAVEAALTDTNQRILFYDWSSVIFADHHGICWADIAAGNYDPYVIAQAGRLKTYGKKLFMSFTAEPDLDTRTGICTGLPGDQHSGSPAEFVRAFQHLHDVFAAQGVTNVVWVIDYSVPSATSANIYYPGDAYVDWIMFDPYNWYGCSGHSFTWIEFADKSQSFYDWAQYSHPSKPVGYAEYGSNEPQGRTGYPATSNSKGQWFRNIAATLATRQPNTKMLVYFDRDDHASSGCWWSVDSSSSAPPADSLDGWRDMGAHPYFNQPHS